MTNAEIRAKLDTMQAIAKEIVAYIAEHGAGVGEFISYAGFFQPSTRNTHGYTEVAASPPFVGFVVDQLIQATGNVVTLAVSSEDLERALKMAGMMQAAASPPTGPPVDIPQSGDPSLN